MPSSISPAPRPVRNNWNIYDTDEVFLWAAALPAGLTDQQILGWQDTVFASGEKHAVLRVLAASRWDYSRDRDGYVLDWLRQSGDRIEPMEPYPSRFLMARTLAFEVAARLAYADPTGVVEGWFSDVRALATAAGLAPQKVYGSPPLMVDCVSEDDGSFATFFGVATDIWFGWNDPWHRASDDPIDNRALAALNAPRLNAFLAEVSTACQSLGGAWTWEMKGKPAGIREVDSGGYVVF